MSKIIIENNMFEKSHFEKEEAKRELQRNIVTGAILRSLHKKQGTSAYLIQVLEPYLKKTDRKLFGLPF